MRTLEQEYAESVYKKVVAFGEKHPKEDAGRNQYGSMAHKLPILIRTAGLAEALAFVESRGKDAHKSLLDDLAVVISENSRDDLLRRSREPGLQNYMYLTRRTMLALKWFKRFAQSILEVDATAEGEVS
ncbi:MAG: type III-B CRISPR module-associated protein Cmr5 [Anaerolineales bacterium]